MNGHLRDYDEALRRHRHHRRAHLKSVRADRSMTVLRRFWTHDHYNAAHAAAQDARYDLSQHRAAK